MPTIVSVGSITIVDVNDGAPGPAVVVTGNRPLNFTATDGVLDSAQPNIVLTAEVFGLASAAYVWTFLGFETSPVSSGTSVQTITMAQFGTSRAASVTCTVNGLYVSQVTIVRAERSTAEAGATVGATFGDYNGVGKNISGTITPGNVTTYIDNAAIGNAQIGGDIWSSNFVAGSAGWRIYRSGNAEFRNITARGDVEASSLKANTAMVDTLHIHGDAVTVPVSAFTAGAISANSYPAGWSTVVIQTAWIDAGGSPVFVTGTCAVFFNPNISSFFDYFELVAPSGAVITMSGRVYTNQGSSDTISISGVSYEAGTYQFRARTYLNASYSQSSWEISYRGLNLLGTKR